MIWAGWSMLGSRVVDGWGGRGKSENRLRIIEVLYCEIFGLGWYERILSRSVFWEKPRRIEDFGSISVPT
jgi:hypothetical protein